MQEKYCTVTYMGIWNRSNSQKQKQCLMVVARGWKDASCRMGQELIFRDEKFWRYMVVMIAQRKYGRI